MACTSLVLKMLPVLKALEEKTVTNHQKSAKTVKLFSSIALVIYGNFHKLISEAAQLYYASTSAVTREFMHG